MTRFTGLRRLALRSLPLVALLLAACMAAGDDAPVDDTAIDDEAPARDTMIGDAPDDVAADGALDVAAGETAPGGPTSQLVNPTPAGPTQLPFMVRVHSEQGGCSGILIATDRVLTAAHCFCTADTVGGNTCYSTGTVTFRNRPDGRPGPTVNATATIHPSYDPSWIDNAALSDLAVVQLASPAPSYATPVKVATSLRPSTYNVMLAGFGHTGSDCDGAGGTLNYQFAVVDGHEADTRIMRIDGQQVCHGDSGGAVLDTQGTTLYAVISSYNLTLSHGWVTKSNNTAPAYNWIRGLTCASDREHTCEARSPMCLCSAGVGDCDVDADCKAGLHCAQNVGATFGYPADTDVCVAPGPLEGTCGCGDSGLGQVCTPAYDGCAAGYAAVCNPRMRTPAKACGGCTCTRI